jgi:hypothetical protein
MGISGNSPKKGIEDAILFVTTRSCSSLSGRIAGWLTLKD